MSSPEQRVQAHLARELDVAATDIRTGSLEGEHGVVVSALPWPADRGVPTRGDWIAGRSYYVTTAGEIYKVPSSAASPVLAARYLDDPAVRERARVLDAGEER